MKVNINFKFFSQNVSVGYCLILLGMTIECVYAAVIRPDARWLLILLTFFVDLFCVFDIGRICRSLEIDLRPCEERQRDNTGVWC